MAIESATIVKRLWNYCNVLRDDGVSSPSCWARFPLIAPNLGRAVERGLVPQRSDDETAAASLERIGEELS
jgi:hypothetical protein